MATKVCARDGCEKPLKGRQRLYCSDRCRFRAWQQRQHEPPAAPGPPERQEDDFPPPPAAHGAVRKGAEATLEALRAAGRLEQVDQARVAALLRLADLVDEGGIDAGALWGHYLKVEASLREVHDEPDAFGALLNALRGDVPAEVGDSPHA